MHNKIAIYGAYGHTGKFILSALHQHGLKPILCGRNKEKLENIGTQYPDLKIAVADISNAESLDIAFADVTIIINCAGPFLDTAEPIIESALRLGKHYIDVSAEQKSVLNVYEKYSKKAAEANILVMPAIAFFGGLADLLSTLITDSWHEIENINIYIGLDSWYPTKGTRLTGQRNHYQKFTLANGQLEPLEASPSINWSFPKPLANREMIKVPLTEIITISRHLKVKNICTYISLNAIEDIRNETTPEPTPADKKNRSSQHFCMQVVASNKNNSKTIIAQGKDIYAVTAPLVVEATKRILQGDFKINGTTTLGQTFNVSNFLKSLNQDDILISSISEI
jgi:hypothetical protein